ncbi:META domain-containing protein [Sabulibacter ruber]|uniref:META domain-containing protein n=1 Tax=Sabulibacter ruber TaxID=2811901 RepID=UPI001A95ED60|nr:META domain-containing protein [Sabulibacter ruber]
MSLLKPHTLYLFSVLTLLGIALFSSCSDSDDDASSGLLGSWMLSEMEGAPVSGNNLSAEVLCADLVFTLEEVPSHSSEPGKYRLSGHLPVNSYDGNYVTVPQDLFTRSGGLNVFALGSSEKLGSEQEMAFEAQYLNALRQVNQFEVKDDVLTLSDTDSGVELTYVRGASSCGR